MLSLHIYYRNSPILKILGQFENLGFVFMSTRENIRLIARAPCLILVYTWHYVQLTVIDPIRSTIIWPITL